MGTLLMSGRALRLGGLAAVCVASAASGQTIWDEAIDGDLSNDRLDPTALVLSLGTNSLFATSVKGDREYVRLDVPEGMKLSGIILTAYESLSVQSFIGVQAGTTFTEDPANADVANILGYTHFGPGAGNVGTNILDDMGKGEGAIGFKPPLPAGEYTYWMQETGTDPATWQFDFIVVPSPGSATAILFGGLIAGRRRR
jgi:hypothetical protein